MMVNPRRVSYGNNNSQTSENPFHNQSLSLSSLLNLLKKPQAFPFLLSIFVLLTWVSLRFQSVSYFSSPPRKLQRWNKDDDLKANLVRFLPSQLSKDKRGWLLNPVSFALDAGISGGAVTCASVHVGEIRPGGMRGNHRHYTCNETFIIWGARTKFRLENNEVVDKGYAEVIIGADEVAIAASPSGTAHALVNVDPVRTAFLLGCQDSVVNYNSSTTAYKVPCFFGSGFSAIINKEKRKMAGSPPGMVHIYPGSVGQVHGRHERCELDTGGAYRGVVFNPGNVFLVMDASGSIDLDRVKVMYILTSPNGIQWVVIPVDYYIISSQLASDRMK